MTEITIPYHLIIPALISIGLLLTILIKRKKLFNKKYKKSFWFSVVTFLVLYSLVVSISAFSSIYFQWDLTNYDLDGNGFFNETEINKEQEAAMFKVINDTARNFSVFSGIIIAILISLPIYLTGILIEKYRNKGFKQYNKSHY